MLRSLVIALSIFAAACGRKPLPESEIQTVRSASVERISPEAVQRYSAAISPLTTVDLAFKSAGIVDHLQRIQGADGRMRDIQAGDMVKEGTELAVVRTIDYEQRVQQTQAQVVQAEAQLEQAQANFREADIEYTRAKKLFESASLVKPQYDQAAGRYEAARASVDAAQAAIQTARTVVDQARLSLSDTTLRAPFTGWITTRNVEPGSLVGNNTVGFSMMDTHLVKAVFALPDVSLKLVRLGQKRTILLDALQQTLAGVVTSISPQADPKSRVFLIELTIDNPKEDVRPGMLGTLMLSASIETEPRLVVPLGSVVRSTARPDGFAVYRVRDQGGKTFAAIQEIAIGNTYGNSIEVVSGLAAGDPVVSVGGSLLHNGQEIRVLP